MDCDLDLLENIGTERFI